MTEFTMTYDEALKVLESCNDETMKEAAKTACKALRAEIGRSRRFATDLECAESDYVRDIAYDQDLEGEDADSFFGKVDADGFDLMEAFHDGAEWQREREHDGMTFEDFCHVKYMLEEILERSMERSEVVKITQELHTQAFNVGLFKSKKAVWHTLDEKADLSKSILMYDVDGNFMSPPVRCPFSFDDFFVKTMNKKYGANYTMWVYMDDIKPKMED